MDILITGGTTFISRYTAEYFAGRGNAVTVINRGTKKQPEGVTHICCDREQLGDTLKGRHFDLIIDTAYTKAQVQALVESGVSFDDYVFISSSAVYPETGTQPFTEEQECRYNTVWKDYGMNKIEAEQYLTENVPSAYILRPPYFYGKYENLYRELFAFDCAAQDRPFCLPPRGDIKLQFFSVDDLCRFIVILLEKHPEEHIFNVGDPQTVTIREWIELCYKTVGKKAEFISAGKEFPQRAYFCFYDYEYVLDVSRQQKLMPDMISLEQGLREEYEWYISDPDAQVIRKPYTEYIDSNIAVK